jgi:hypothetical protein
MPTYVGAALQTDLKSEAGHTVAAPLAKFFSRIFLFAMLRLFMECK